MKAAVLRQTGFPLEIEEAAPPELRDSSVRVRVLASPVFSFIHLIFAGVPGFSLPVPYTPGVFAIGAVEETAGDVAELRAGQIVFCNPLVLARTSAEYPERILKGLMGSTDNCEPLLRQWKNGTFAEQAVFPAECLTPLDGLDGCGHARLAGLYYLCVAYGAYMRGRFKPGQSVLVTGATGNLGTAAVLVALALGASRVYASGRNESVLRSLVELDPRRVAAVPLDGGKDYAESFAACADNVDLLVDAIGNIDTPALFEAALSKLKRGGTAMLAGGSLIRVGMPYLAAVFRELTVTGSFMFPRTAPAEIVKLIRSGLLDLEAIRPVVFPLEQVNEAIAAASGMRGLDYCVLEP